MITNKTKRSLKERSKLTKSYYKNGQDKKDYEKLLEKSSDCTKEILEAKRNYILKMATNLQDRKTAAKSYWAILREEKIPGIPPLFVNGKFVSDCCEEESLFNNFFASVCTPIKNSSVLPLFSYRTNARMPFRFTKKKMKIF